MEVLIDCGLRYHAWIVILWLMSNDSATQAEAELNGHPLDAFAKQMMQKGENVHIRRRRQEMERMRDKPVAMEIGRLPVGAPVPDENGSQAVAIVGDAQSTMAAHAPDLAAEAIGLALRGLRGDTKLTEFQQRAALLAVHKALPSAKGNDGGLQDATPKAELLKLRTFLGNHTQDAEF